MPYHLVAFLISALVVLWSTPIVKKIGLKSGYVDLPDPRKVHKKPMVRLGGVSIFIGNVFAWLIIWISGGFSELPSTSGYELLGVTGGGLCFFTIGLLDDLFHAVSFVKTGNAGWRCRNGLALGRQRRFLYHSVLWSRSAWLAEFTVYCPLAGWYCQRYELYGRSRRPSCWHLWDCSSHYAGGEFVHEPTRSGTLSGSASRRSTRVFCDTTLIQLKSLWETAEPTLWAFTLAALGIIGLVKSVTTVAVVLPFIILAVPIVDTSTVVIDRLSRGKSPFTADKRHLHHRLLQAGLSQRSIVLFIYSLAFWVGSIAMTYAGLPGGKAYMIGASLLLVYSTWQAWRRIQKKQDED